MHIVPTQPETASTPSPLLMLPIDPAWGSDAANDNGRVTEHEDIVDLNTLVARVVGHVTSRMQPKFTNVALKLAPGRPVVRGDAAALAFAVSGVLGAELRALEESADLGELEVETRVEGETVKVFIAANDLPPLGLVRAVEGNSPDSDPTVAHCRRLVESHGGYIELVACDDRIGFAIVLPTLPVVCPIRHLPRDTDSRSDRLALVA